MASYEIPGTEPDPKTLNTGDTLLVKSAGTATEYTVAGGELKVNGKAVTTTLNSGKMYVYGQATGTTMAGGTLYMKGGTIDTLTMTGGTLTMSAGTATKVNVNGGSFKVNSASCVADQAVVNGGTMFVYNGTANNTQVKAGTMTMSGGAASGTIVNGGGFHVSAGTVTNTTVNGGVATVHTAGTVDGVTVNFGGKLTVNGAATGVVENGGYVEDNGNVSYVENTFSGVNVTSGSATVHAQTTAKNLSVGAKGHVYLNGGKLTGTVRFTGGDITVNGGTLEFDTTTMTANNGYLYDTLGEDRFIVNTAPTFTILVTDGQQQGGKYALGKNAVARTIGTGDNQRTVNAIVGSSTSFTLKSTTGWEKTITIGETIEDGNGQLSTYSLGINATGTLVLTISAGISETFNTSGTNQPKFHLGTDWAGDPENPEETSDTQTGVYLLTIKKGTFNAVVNCGDRVTAANYSLTHQKALATVVEGGAFNKSIAGGLMKTADGSIRQEGDVNLTIKDGSFNSGCYIFGGNVSANSSLAQTADKDVIVGNVNITLDASSSALSFQKSIYAGSYGKGRIIADSTSNVGGNVGITLTGSNKVTVLGDLWGACSGDQYKCPSTGVNKPGRDRYLDTNITGSRTLTFQGFNSTLAAGNINGFDTLVCDNSTVVIENKKTKKIAFGDIENWEFSLGSSITGDFGNNFYNDTLTLGKLGDTLSGDDPWTVMESTYTGKGFEAFNALSSVKIFGVQASKVSSICWATSDYQVSIVDGSKMQVSAVIA